MNYREMIQKRIDEVQAELESYGFKRFPLTFDVKKLKRGVSGVAHLAQGDMSFSIDYLKEHSATVIHNTVPHEICHHYVTYYYPMAKQHHGPEFRRLMNLLGLDGKTHHAMSLSNAPSRRKNKVTRYVYITKDSKTEILLTCNQHKKQQMYAQQTGKSLFHSKKTGEALQFTNKMKKV